MSILLLLSGSGASNALAASPAGSATLTANASVRLAAGAHLASAAVVGASMTGRDAITAVLAGSASIVSDTTHPVAASTDLISSSVLIGAPSISLAAGASVAGTSSLAADLGVVRAAAFGAPTFARPQWPSTILPPRKVMVDPVYATISAGRSITGVEQVIAGDAGYWAITLDEIPCARQVQKQAARALSVQLNGRLGTIDIPLWDQKNAPGWMASSLVPFGDQAPFGDDSLFSSDAPIEATVAAAVALGANSMTVDLVVGTTLQPGQHFSVTGATSKQRLFRIIQATLESGTTWLLSVWPPAREAISAGTSANFNDPRCTCRLKTDAEMMTFVDDYAGRTLAKVDFEEALP